MLKQEVRKMFTRKEIRNYMISNKIITLAAKTKTEIEYKYTGLFVQSYVLYLRKTTIYEEPKNTYNEN